MQNFNALHGHEIELCIQQFVHSHYLEIYADEIREIADLQDGKKHGFIEIAISIAENRIINYDLYYSDRSNFRPLVRQYLYYIVTYFTTVRRLYGDEAVRNIGTYAALGFMPYYEDMREAYQDLNLPESEVLLYLTKSEVDELLSDVEVK